MFDVIIIGAGVIGSAVARELSRYQLNIGVLEKNLDVCNEGSGRNSAVIHGGFAYDLGSKKARFCVEGCLGFKELADLLDIPFKETGKVLVGNTEADYQRLLKTIETGEKNGSVGLRMIDKEELKTLVPAVNGEFAMFSPHSGIVDPFHYTIALAENAHANGVDFYFNHEVEAIQRLGNDLYKIQTSQGAFETKWVINCAGLNCVKISDMLGIEGYELHCTKGDYIVLDKKLGPLLPMPVYPVPSNTYMGIHVTPTVDGNVTVGPNANRVTDTENYGVSKAEMIYLAEDASTLWPHIHKKDYIRNYAGIQPTWKDGPNVIKDYVIELREEAPHTINLIGMESPALTSAVPIARYVAKLFRDQEKPKRKDHFISRRRGQIKFSELGMKEKEELIRENPDYGEIICRCECVTKAEVLNAIHNPLGVDSMLGIKYRTRAMMGRCQGGYCQMRIAQLIEEEKEKAPEAIRYGKSDGYMFVGKVK